MLPLKLRPARLNKEESADMYRFLKDGESERFEVMALISTRVVRNMENWSSGMASASHEMDT